MQDGERSVQLVYYGMSQNMESLNRYFNCDAYDGNNSVYVLDSQGSRVFRSNASENPLQAYNAFSSLSEMEYLHGTSFEVTQDELERSGLSYSNAVLDGEEYHYALYRMESADWVLLFLVPSRFVAQDTVSLVRTTGTLVLVFSLVMVGAAVLVIYTILRRKQIQYRRSNWNGKTVSRSKRSIRSFRRRCRRRNAPKRLRRTQAAPRASSFPICRMTSAPR